MLNVDPPQRPPRGRRAAAPSPPRPTRSPTRSRPSRRRSRRSRAKSATTLIERGRGGVAADRRRRRPGRPRRTASWPGWRPPRDELAAIAAGRGGRLRIASFPTAGATLMPQAIAAFRASHPGVEVTLAEGEPEEIAPRLRAGEFDLVLLFEFEGVGERLGRRHAPLRAASRTRSTWPCPPATRSPTREQAAARGPARGVLGPDLGRQPLRPPRRPLLPRRRLRAPRLLRERRLPDRPGPGRGRRRRRR